MDANFRGEGEDLPSQAMVTARFAVSMLPIGELFSREN